MDSSKLYFNLASNSLNLFQTEINSTIVSGAITLGFVQQITRAFGRVENSLQYLVRSWSTIVELISVWKRLSEFEARLKYNSEESTVENI